MPNLAIRLNLAIRRIPAQPVSLAAQHVSVEIEFSALIFLFLFSATLPFYETVFLPLRLTTNTRSRAPPAFSNKPANFAI